LELRLLHIGKQYFHQTRNKSTDKKPAYASSNRNQPSDTLHLLRKPRRRGRSHLLRNQPKNLLPKMRPKTANPRCQKRNSAGKPLKEALKAPHPFNWSKNVFGKIRKEGRRLFYEYGWLIRQRHLRSILGVVQFLVGFAKHRGICVNPSLNEAYRSLHCRLLVDYTYFEQVLFPL